MAGLDEAKKARLAKEAKEAKVKSTKAVVIPVFQLTVSHFLKVKVKPLGAKSNLAYTGFKTERGVRRVLVQEGVEYFKTQAKARAFIRQVNRDLQANVDGLANVV